MLSVEQCTTSILKLLTVLEIVFYASQLLFSNSLSNRCGIEHGICEGIASGDGNEYGRVPKALKSRTFLPCAMDKAEA